MKFDKFVKKNNTFLDSQIIDLCKKGKINYKKFTL